MCFGVRNFRVFSAQGSCPLVSVVAMATDKDFQMWVIVTRTFTVVTAHAYPVCACACVDVE